MIFAVCSAVISSYDCYSQKQDSVWGCDLIFLMDFSFIQDHKIQPFKETDTIQAYSVGDYQLYKLAAKRRLETNEKVPGTEPYFIYKKGTPLGFWLNGINDTVGKLLPVDSVLTSRAFKVEITDLLSKGWIHHKDDTKGNTVIAKYSATMEVDADSPDSVWIYFSSELANCGYSFSRILEQQRKLKITKVQYVFNSKNSRKYNMVVPRRETSVSALSLSIDHSIVDFGRKLICRYFEPKIRN